jgi:hypothetical protein
MAMALPDRLMRLVVIIVMAVVVMAIATLLTPTFHPRPKFTLDTPWPK